MSGAAEDTMFAEEASDIATFVKQLHTARGSEVSQEDVERAAACAKAGDVAGLVAVIVSRLDSVFAHADEDEVKGVFHILGSMLAVDGTSANRALVMKLSAEAASNTESDQRLRLTIIVSLFNTLPYDSQERRDLFLALLRYAAATQQLRLLFPFLNDFQKHIDMWGVTPQQACALHVAVADVLEKAGEGERSRSALMHAVDTAEPARAEDLAVRCIRSALQQPFALQAESLLHTPAVQALKSGKHASLFRLLEVVSVGTVAQFDEFRVGNAQTIADAGLDADVLQRTMRILTLATACAGKPSTTYAEVAQAIAVPEDQVESWVIAAMDAKVLEAQMDDDTKKIAILRTSPRVFEAAQWGPLASKLSQWKDNVESLLSAVESARSEQRV